MTLCCCWALRWLILGFKREFSFEDALTLFEIMSSQHLEMDSLEGAIAREKGRKHEAENVGKWGMLY